MRRFLWQGLLLLVAVAILWRGGKSLDLTWLTSLGVSVLVIVSAVFDMRAKNHAHTPWLLWIGTLLFVAWTVVSFLLSSTGNYGFDEVLRTTSYGLLLLLLVREAAQERGQTMCSSFARTVAAVTLLACAVGVAIYVLQPVSRFVGTFFDYRFHTDYWPNAWAEFLLLAWPLVAWSLFASRLPVFLVRAAVLGFVLGCLFLSYSRGSMIAFAGQFIVLLVLVGWHFRLEFPWKKALLAACTAVVCAMFFFLAINHLRSQFYPVESVSRKVTFTADEGGSSVSERSEFWKQAATLGALRPLFGWGPYSFRFVQPHIQTSVLATSDHAHNVFLKFFAERGIVAVLLFLCFVLWVIVAGLRNFLVRGHVLSLVLSSAFIGVIAHNLIDYNLQFVGIALPLSMIAAFLLAGSVRSSLRGAVVQRTAEALIALLLLFVTVHEGWYQLWSTLGRHALASGVASEQQHAQEYFARAAGSRFPRDTKLTEASLLLSRGNTDGARDALRNYTALNAEDSRVWYLLGDVEMADRKYEAAAEAYRRAFQYGRQNDLGILRGLLEAWIAAGDRKSLIESREEVSLLLSDFAIAIERNLHFVALSGNVEELMSIAAILARANPSESDQYEALMSRINEVASRERAEISSRPRGLLWEPSRR